VTSPGDNLRRLAAQSPEARIEALKREIEALTQTDPYLERARVLAARIEALRSRKQEPKK
jgi:hypothetical protein